MSDPSEAEKVVKKCYHTHPKKKDVMCQHRAGACASCIDQAITKARQEKPLTWFKTPNPLLGNVSPIDMIRSGRGEKLCKWIDQTIKEGEM